MLNSRFQMFSLVFLTMLYDKVGRKNMAPKIHIIANRQVGNGICLPSFIHLQDLLQGFIIIDPLWICFYNTIMTKPTPYFAGFYLTDHDPPASPVIRSLFFVVRS